MNTNTKVITLRDEEYWSGHSDEALAHVIKEFDALVTYYSYTGHYELMDEAQEIAAAAYAQLAHR